MQLKKLIFFDFETDIEDQFKNLLDIEKLEKIMKKIVLVSVIFLLILFTAIIKNTAKQIEDELFTVNENLRVLKTEYENIFVRA